MDKRDGWNRWKTVTGYIMMERRVKTNIKERIPEHRYIMQTYLGRPLEKDEVVHHINGVRDDNRIENLELWLKAHPPGQRVVDKLAFAKELIKRYRENG